MHHDIDIVDKGNTAGVSRLYEVGSLRDNQRDADRRFIWGSFRLVIQGVKYD